MGISPPIVAIRGEGDSHASPPGTGSRRTRSNFTSARSEELAAFLTATLRVGRQAGGRQAGERAGQTGGRRRASWSQWLLLPRADSVSISIQWQPRAISIRVGSRSWFHTRHARFFAISPSYVAACVRSACVRACVPRRACMHACMHARACVRACVATYRETARGASIRTRYTRCLSRLGN